MARLRGVLAAAAMGGIMAAGPAWACTCALNSTSDAIIRQAHRAFVGTIVSAKLSKHPFLDGDFTADETVAFRVTIPIRGVAPGEIVSFHNPVRAGSCMMSTSPNPDPNYIINRFEPITRPGRPLPRVDWKTWLIVDNLNMCGVSRPLSVREAGGSKSSEVRRLRRLLRP